MHGSAPEITADEPLMVDGLARGRPRMDRVRRLWVLLFLSIVVAVSAASTGAGARPRAQRPVRFPALAGAVPVLVYHRLTATDSSYAVSPAVFEAQMQRLHELGFEAIRLDGYVRFMRGGKVALPPRPILITFDDASFSAWENADPILARYRWTAVMYVPTGVVGWPGRLTWAQLRQMQASGRWQIDEHAGDGHVLVTIDPQGRLAPFYANEVWADGAQETFARYKLRVSSDIKHGAAQLAHFLPGRNSYGTFAVPFNNYGDHGSNDPRIEPWLRGYLTAHFAVTFVQKDYSFTTPGQAFANRIAVSSNIEPDMLEQRLLSGLRT